jgi:hypothetical protein
MYYSHLLVDLSVLHFIIFPSFSLLSRHAKSETIKQQMLVSVLPAKNILNVHSATTAPPTLELLQPLLTIPVVDLPLLLVRQHLVRCSTTPLSHIFFMNSESHSNHQVINAEQYAGHLVPLLISAKRLVASSLLGFLSGWYLRASLRYDLLI